jgi:hypothetical protein
MKPLARSNIVRIIVTELLFLPVSFGAQQSLSHVRVVRLSYVSGTVAIKRPGSIEWAKAIVNTPIEEGFTLATSTGSFACLAVGSSGPTRERCHFRPSRSTSCGRATYST